MKRRFPVSISNSTTPNAQMSARLSTGFPAFVERTESSDLPAVIGKLAEAEALARRLLMAQAAPRQGKPESNISVAEAARDIGMSKDWIYKNADKLPFTRRIGRRIVVSVAELSRYQKRRRSR